MPDPLTTISTRRTPRSAPADPRQSRNAAGGNVFAVDDVARVRQFLPLGIDGGTYNIGERELTRDNAGILYRRSVYGHLAVTKRDVSVRAPDGTPADDRLVADWQAELERAGMSGQLEARDRVTR